MAKAVGKDKFLPPQLQNCLVDFDEIRTLELPLKTMHHTKFHFDPTMWVVLRIRSLPLTLKSQFPEFIFPQVVQRHYYYYYLLCISYTKYKI